MKRPRILVAEDHPLFLSGLRTLLETECEVVGAVSDGRSLVEAASRLKPEVIVLDISLPLLNGIDAARQIKKEQPETKVLFLTMHANLAYLKDALAAGAAGYLLKTSAREELLGAVQDVIRNRIHVSPGFRGTRKTTTSPRLGISLLYASLSAKIWSPTRKFGAMLSVGK